MLSPHALDAKNQQRRSITEEIRRYLPIRYGIIMQKLSVNTENLYIYKFGCFKDIAYICTIERLK